MKKIVLVILILIVMAGMGTPIAKAADLAKDGLSLGNGLKFGMTFEEAKSELKGEEPFEEDNGIRKIFKRRKFMGYVVDFMLDFDEDSLFQIIIAFPTDDKSLNELKKDYDKITKNVNKIYTKQAFAFDYVRWDESVSYANQNESIQAVRAGLLTYSHDWSVNKSNTQVRLSISGGDNHSEKYGHVRHWLSLCNNDYWPAIQRRADEMMPKDVRIEAFMNRYIDGDIVENPMVIKYLDSKRVFVFAMKRDNVISGFSFDDSDILECAMQSQSINEDAFFKLLDIYQFAYAFFGNYYAPMSSSDIDKIVDARNKKEQESPVERVGSYDLYRIKEKDFYYYLYLHQDSKLTPREAIKAYESEYPVAEYYKLLNGELPINNTTDASKEAVTLSSGEYNCPAHISAGEYRITPLKSGIVTIKRGDDLVITEYLNISDGDEIGRAVLKSGDTIEISGGKMSFEPFK